MLWQLMQVYARYNWKTGPLTGLIQTNLDIVVISDEGPQCHYMAHLCDVMFAFRPQVKHNVTQLHEVN